MIVVKVELHSAITSYITPLALMTIANDGTGTKDIGNYNINLIKKNSTEAYKIGKVKNHHRLKLHVWILVLKALQNCYPEI